ncbi:thiamine pyrophosphate-dependent enzyme [Marimonas lutisalis]|uniref:thiamine pyrophosphate-dependent enzyme n=1 Tax=Marimonas lutisalis TaxID=2545756 RepID=UPI0010F99CD1|nr:thiamine pyrophosphate-dependent enzyme [Marimonas lutisalis]
MSERMTGGAALVRRVLEHGVDTVFALPGVQTYPLMDALQKAGNRVRVVHPRHEQTAAYMAMGYAKATGKPGVFSVVPGPGVLNAGAALCTMVATNAPVLMLTGQVPSGFLGRGRGHLHEIPDQQATLRSFIKWADRVPRAAEAPALVDEAFARMQSGRPGPVALEMCWDTMAEEGAVDFADLPPRPEAPAPDARAIVAAAELLAGAKRPMIVVGAGAQHAGPEVQALAETLGAPVSAFRGGRGVVPDTHPLAAQSAAAYEMWAETDVLIGIGSRCEMPTMRWTGMMAALDRVPGNRKLIRIEIDAEELLRLKPDVGIVADAAEGARALTAALAGRVAPDPGAQERVAAARAAAREQAEAVQPQVGYLDAIREVLPREGILVKDICQVGFASYFAWDVYGPRTYLTSGYQGNLGFAFPTALGAKVGCPETPVVVVTGDGGFMFAAQELSTAAQHGIGVVTIVFNNSAYGNVRRDQQTRFEGRVIASDLPGIDYIALAGAQGVQGYRVDSPEALKPVLAQAIAADQPALIEVMDEPGSEGDPWPLILRQPV